MRSDQPPRSWSGLTIFVAASALLVLGAAVACSGTTSSSLLPTTGIVVRAETLTTARGCGMGATQLFKYAVVVFGYRGAGASEGDRASYDVPVTSNVFDCYADGTFIELPSTAGNSTFRLEVFAYNEPSFSASRGAIESAGADPRALRATAPTWTTECTATQQPEVQSLAVCSPLAPGLSGIVGGTAGPTTKIALETTRFRLADGRLATCASAPSDAGAPDAEASDADVPDAADAPDAADGAGTPIVFTTVRVRYRAGGAIGPTVDVACPTTFVTDVAAEPRAYALDVGLIDPAGAPLGATTCSVTTVPGTTSSAVCP